MINQRELNKFLKGKDPWITFLYFFVIYPIIIKEDITTKEFKESYSKFEDVISRFTKKK